LSASFKNVPENGSIIKKPASAGTSQDSYMIQENKQQQIDLEASEVS